MADIPLSNALGGAASSGPRRETHVLTDSDAALAVPSWAQGGNGLAYVTMCGGGQGGGNRVGGSVSGGGGSPTVFRYPLLIPSGVTTINCQVGAGGAGAAANSNIDGAAGGESSVTAGSASVRISRTNGLVSGTVTTGGDFSGQQGNALASADMATLIYAGGTGTTTAVGGNLGAGGRSALGVGGSGWATAPTNTAGDPAKGYGAGGGIGYGTGKGGDGAPGLLIVEFAEAL